jgi:sensory rhodopsin
MVDVTTLTYAVGTLGMLAGVFVAVQLVRDTRGGGQFGYLLIIPGFAALAYAVMTLGVGTVTFQGYTIPVPRYVDWLVTTPVLVGYAAYVAGAGRRWILGVALADAAMIVLGGTAVVLAPPGRWLAFGASSAFHLALLGVVYAVLPGYAAEQNSKRRRLAEILRNHVGLLWIAYPVVWLLGPGLDLVSATAVAMIITYLDVVAKVPYVYFVYRAREGFEAVTPASEGPSSPDRGVSVGD